MDGNRRHGEAAAARGFEESAPVGGGPVAEMLEGVMLAVESGCAAQGEPRGLDGEGPAAAHGAGEGFFGGVPPGFEEDGRGEVFAEGGDPRAEAVAAPGEGDAAGVEMHPRHAVAPVQSDAGGAFGVRLGVGAGAGFADEAVGDGVLAAEEGEARVAESGGFGVAVEVEGGPGGDPLFPGQASCGGVEFVGGAGTEGGDLEEDAVGGAEPEVELEGFAQVTFDAEGGGGEVSGFGMPEGGEFAA